MALVLAAVLVAATAPVAGGPPAGAQTAQDPILFVHGFSSSGSTWDTMIWRFRAAGYTSDRLLAISYNSFQSNATIANDVRNGVNTLRSRTGATRVDIVTHSMGGLSSRYYLKNLGGTAVVDEWVSLGGPNHGTSLSGLCSWLITSCNEMRVGSSFLTALNAGDETPGDVRYGTFWSGCDGVIWPASSTVLSGAANTQLWCIGHLSLISDSGVFARVRDFVR
jgi:triacylglycerol lipase